ncbi:MAG TPA: M36 family metallopeptidase, partial [Pyrinomonadaceae bacterium]|nr:M36 family metallopeptidase [Pyrinomonadaceae bacterium]
GGLGNDSISVEVQDSSGTNGGNFASPADGGRGRLQCFIWTGSTPDRDAALDSQYIFHELTHGVSSRLHGNGSGLGNQGGMMGEGWSDFYAMAMLSEPTDDQLGTYTLAGYIMHLLSGMESNYYYGIRRFPIARKASVGANGLPHNPLTFGYLNVGCDAQIGTTTTNPNSAFPRNPIIATSGNCAQVHNGGEIWALALWEMRGELINRHGAAEGNRRSLQYTTDGMKLTPINPNMLQERDGIIAAAFASDSADVPSVRRGFAIRGMGFSASVQSATAVTEAFDVADLNASSATVTTGDNLLEPGECNALNVPIVNFSQTTATTVNAVLSTTTSGITVTQPNSIYPNISAGGTANNTTAFLVSV